MKKMNKAFYACAFVALTLSAGFLSGCRHDDGGEGIDTSKAQIYIMNYQGGYGNEWLYNAKEKYEALHANTQYGDKTGVQILIEESTTRPTSDAMKNEKYSLYFFEELDFNTLYSRTASANALYDITDIVLNNPYEPGKSIESKLTDVQKAYFSDNGHYYALPHNASTSGISYNKTVFESKGLYFAEGYETKTGDAKFVRGAQQKSAGPDGIHGNDDDGLPVTYDDFYDLCDFMVKKNVVPFTAYEKNSADHIGFLATCMAADHDGATQNAVQYSMDGEISVAKLNDDKTGFVVNADGSLATEKVTVLPNKADANDGKGNGFEVQRAEGKYYGLKFIRKLIDRWEEKDGLKGWASSKVSAADSQFSVHKAFILSQFGLVSTQDYQTGLPIGMLIDGDWWFNEAKGTMSELTDQQRSQLDFGWMPLPRYKKSDTKRALLDTGNTMALVNNFKDDAIKQRSADFLAFMNTDESLRDYTVCTNSRKALKYDLTDADYAKLSSFGKSFLSYSSKCDLVSPISRNSQFAGTLSGASLSRRWAISNQLSWPDTEFRKNPTLTPEKYLFNMYTHYRKSVWAFTYPGE